MTEEHFSAEMGFMVMGKSQGDGWTNFNMSNEYKQDHMTLFIIPTGSLCSEIEDNVGFLYGIWRVKKLLQWVAILFGLPNNGFLLELHNITWVKKPRWPSFGNKKFYDNWLSSHAVMIESFKTMQTLCYTLEYPKI